LFKINDIAIIFALSGYAVFSPALDLDDTGGVQLGPVTAHPSIEVSTRYDDNLFFSDKNEKSTLIGIVSPAVNFSLQDNIKRLTLDYGIEAGLHEDSSPDDYADQKLLGVLEYNPTDRIKTELRAEYLDEHDSRGTERTEGGSGSLDPDEWHSYGIGGLVGYGTPNATGRAEFEAGYTAKEYDNNRLFTFDRDRNDFDLRGTFFYKIWPKTRLLFEIKQTVFEYERNAIGQASLDSTGRDYLFGAAWDATYKTTGFAKFGVSEKDFDSDLRKDVDLFKWEIGVKWMPRTYSTVDITTVRRQDETNGFGDSIDVGEIKVSWNHIWPNRITSTIGFFFAENDYNATGRVDEIFKTGLKLDYDWRRWARISAGYEYKENDSNVSTFGYERNLFDITVNFSL
jgi:polysaccharide biosynthesis protein VpsM